MYAYNSGCVLRDTVQVTVTNNNGLTANAGADAGFCVGDSVQLSGSSSDAAATFAWQPSLIGMSLASSTTAAPFVKPNISTDYVLEATVGNCKSYDTVHVEVRQKPQTYLPFDDMSFGYPRFHLCDGATQVVNMGLAANTYNLLTPDVVTDWNNNNTLTISDDGWLKVVTTSPNGCTARDSTAVVYAQNQPPPPIVSNIPTSRSVCAGDTVQYEVLLTTTGSYAPNDFQFSWYGGWQVDSLDGLGFRDIAFYDLAEYDVFLYSWGNFSSAYYAELLIRNVQTSGLKYRAYINDFCSERNYTNVMTVYIGPKISQQPTGKVLCTGVTDSISVNSSAINANYQWQVKQNGNWQNVTPTAGVISPNGRWLRFYNAQAGLDSLYRCMVTGCTENTTVASDSAVVRVAISPVLLSQTPTIDVCEGTNAFLTFETNDGPFQYQWYQNNTALTFNTSQYTGYNNDTLFFSPLSTSQNIYTYKCRIYNTQCAVQIYTDTVRLQVQSVPNVTWFATPQTACISATGYQLGNGSPDGGTYSGPFVTGSLFDANAAGLGSYTLTYTQNYTYPNNNLVCTDAASATFNVVALPIVALNAVDNVCIGSGNFPMTGGSPTGGTYYAAPPYLDAVQNGIFQANTLSSGSYTVGYSYTAANGCTAWDEEAIAVHNPPSVVWSVPDINVCADAAPITLPEGDPTGGTFTGNSISGNSFQPSLANIGLNEFFYIITDQFGCSGSAAATATVNALPIVSINCAPPLWGTDSIFVCNNYGPYSLDDMGQPTGGIYTGNGVSGNIYDPYGLYDLQTVTYTYTDALTACQASAVCVYDLELCFGTTDAPFANTTVTNSDGLIRIETTENLQAILSNALGQQLHYQALSSTTTLQTPTLPSGIYFVTLSHNGHIKTFKVAVF